MDKLIVKPLEMKALSSDDLEKFFGDTVKWWAYPELAQIQNIDELFGTSKACMILYETRQNFGTFA